jgi:undecaprenyl-diphosphatase
MEASVLGLVQGLTEFLPISSTAHLRIVPELLGWEDPGAAFSAVIQLGTLLAVVLYFWRDIVVLVTAALQSVLRRNLMETESSRLAWAIAVGNLPIIVLGLGFKDFIETDARSLWIVGSALIILAIALYIAEKRSSQDVTTSGLSFKQIQWIGACQALALIPGCSRSGSTIMGGLLVGLTREEAARFSFLLGLPAILGSGLFQLKELAETGLGESGLLNIVLGVFFAFLSGYLSIEFLLRFLRRYGTLVFVVYRIALGALVLFLAI